MEYMNSNFTRFGKFIDDDTVKYMNDKLEDERWEKISSAFYNYTMPIYDNKKDNMRTIYTNIEDLTGIKLTDNEKVKLHSHRDKYMNDKGVVNYVE